MQPQRTLPMIRYLRRVALAAALVVAASTASRAGFTTNSAPSAKQASWATGNAHRCKCETVCTGSCCCVRKEASSSHARTKPAEKSSVSGPCVSQSPCGEGGGPTSFSVSTMARDLSVLPSAPEFEVGASNLVVLPRNQYSSPSATLLDRPPELPA